MRHCLLVWFVAWAMSEPSLAAGEDLSGVSISLVPIPVQQPRIGPIPLQFEFRNPTTATVLVVFGGDLDAGLHLESGGGSPAPESPGSERRQDVQPIVLRPNSTGLACLFLNDYLHFENAGPTIVRWSCSATAADVTNKNSNGVSDFDDKGISIRASGAFGITLENHSDEELKNSLAAYIVTISAAPDSPLSSQYAHGICSVRSPVVIPYLEKMMSIPGWQYVALRCLAYDWFAENSVKKRLISDLMATNDPVAARIVTDAYIQNNCLISTEALNCLLKSRNDGLQVVGIRYARALLHRLSVSNIARLSSEKKDSVSEAASEFFGALIMTMPRSWGGAPLFNAEHPKIEKIGADGF